MSGDKADRFLRTSYSLPPYALSPSLVHASRSYVIVVTPLGLPGARQSGFDHARSLPARPSS